MKIIADENIPLLHDYFGHLGELITCPGRHITATEIRSADALLVRSVTPVNANLLAGSSVKFVATATAGTDHIDQHYLQQQKIAFASAPGCNARSVVEYVLAAVDVVAEKYEFDWEHRVFGVIGHGQVGRRLVQTLQKLGAEVLVTDPFCQPDETINFVSLKTLIQNCDVISLHTPLTHDGSHPTHHMIGPDQLAAMKPGTVLISAGRGAVIDNNALKNHLQHNHDLKVIMDVWEQEPWVDTDLLRLTELATPHIAGYSLDGKIAGTHRIYQALGSYFKRSDKKTPPASKPITYLNTLAFGDLIPPGKAASLAIRSVYDIRSDDAKMRRLLHLDHNAIKKAFDHLRKNYPVRREFNTLKLKLKSNHDAVRNKLVSLGFNLN